MGRAATAASSDPARDVPRGLVWVSDDRPGIRRERKGEGFVYRGPDGRLVRRAVELDRIRALAIPPAYEQVWICPRENGHLQATGRDARGRKQYRYHPLWRESRDADKFVRMREFGAALPTLRRHVERLLDRRLTAAPRRETVLATAVRLLDTTLVRIGNEAYTKQNRSFGLTTLRQRHAQVQGSVIRLQFRGKSGVERDVSLDDPRVARVVRRCQAMPGQDLFQYEDEAGARHAIASDDVNAFLKAVTGADFTAKDFRTWHATVHALDLRVANGKREGHARQSARELLAQVAGKLGNTVAVCKKSYVHPRVLEAMAAIDEASEVRLSQIAGQRPRGGLAAAERQLLRYLESCDAPRRRRV